MAAFKVPRTLPQDLLLISEFVDVQEQHHSPKPLAQDNDDNVESSGSEIESEEEIEKDLTALQDDGDEDAKPSTSDSSSSSVSNSSDSDSDSDSAMENKTGVPRPRPLALGGDNGDEDTVPAANAYVQTKNEIIDVAINIPDLDEVGIDEELEKVGEVLSATGDVVIIKSLPSEFASGGSERTLDSDTLLVFGDRKVMGYIYETFGPTSQPLYQIMFNQEYPLIQDNVQIGREVFHVPSRSRFVFVNQLKRLKGSDASNVHDEEPGEDEIEFSDDEAEAVHRSRLKQKRGRDRAGSVSSSRYTTPTPSQMRDQDMMTESVLNKSAFDEHGPYDLDYGAGPSRPTPKPYDDPSLSADDASPSNGTAASSSSRIQFERSRSRDRSFSQQSEGWGRGRGGRRGKRANNHPRGSSGRDGGFPRSTGTAGADAEGYDPRMPQESLPSPLVQGQNSNYAPSMDTSASWDYPSQPFGQLQSQQPFMFPGPSYQTPYAQPSAFVQPHINPRFASTFGFQVAPSAAGYAQGSPMGSTPPGPGWAEQWTVPTTEHTEPKEDPIP